MIGLVTLLSQHVKDTAKAMRYRHMRPALWETRRWLEQVREHSR